MLSGEQRVRAGDVRREGREKSFPGGCDISAKPCRTSCSAKLLREVPLGKHSSQKKQLEEGRDFVCLLLLYPLC